MFAGCPHIFAINVDDVGSRAIDFSTLCSVWSQVRQTHAHVPGPKLQAVETHQQLRPSVRDQESRYVNLPLTGT